MKTIKEVIAKIDDMLLYNEEFAKKNILPPNVQIPFINGVKLKEWIENEN